PMVPVPTTWTIFFIALDPSRWFGVARLTVQGGPGGRGGWAGGRCRGRPKGGRRVPHPGSASTLGPGVPAPAPPARIAPSELVELGRYLDQCPRNLRVADLVLALVGVDVPLVPPLVAAERLVGLAVAALDRDTS